MQVEQNKWDHNTNWDNTTVQLPDADLLICFGTPDLIINNRIFDELRHRYHAATFVGCSTAGQIMGEVIIEDQLVTTAIKFASTKVRAFYTRITDPRSSYDAAVSLAEQIPVENLKHILLVSDGININGSELAKAFSDTFEPGIIITGGLAGDADRFGQTFVIGPEGAEEGLITAVAFYGTKLKIACGSVGGWDPFGPERIVTLAVGNELFELDDKPVLDLYKKYLGEKAVHLPASALLFPLSLRFQNEENYVVRTVLSIDEDKKSMRFAGDIPKGSVVRLMKANFNRLIDGAATSAIRAKADQKESADFALLISCVGRRLVLKQRTPEELEAVQGILGGDVVLSGFYSYGEISPLNGFSACSLHNQTMTITTYAE